MRVNNRIDLLQNPVRSKNRYRKAQQIVAYRAGEPADSTAPKIRSLTLNYSWNRRDSYASATKFFCKYRASFFDQRIRVSCKR